jgi:hypothetical protein
MAGVIVQQALKTRTGYRAGRRHHTNAARLTERRSRLDARLHRNHRHINRRPNFLSRGRRCGVAGNHQGFGAACHQRPGNQNAAFLEKNLRAVAVGQKAGIGEVKKVLFRELTAQGS